jgi:hypothetical protein
VLSLDVFATAENWVPDVGTATFDGFGITFSNDEETAFTRRWNEISLYREPHRIGDLSDIVLNQRSLPNPEVRSALGAQSEWILQLWFEEAPDKVSTIFIGLPQDAIGQVNDVISSITSTDQNVVPLPAPLGDARRRLLEAHFEYRKQLAGDTSQTLAIALLVAPTRWDNTYEGLAGATEERFYSVPLVIGDVPGRNTTNFVISVPWSRIGDFKVVPQSAG